MPAPADLDGALLLGDVATGTLRLAADAAGLAETDLRAPSALPGWTRGHVLAHVALNAQAFAAVLDAAADGRQIPMYPSGQARDGDIEALAPATGAALLERLLGSAAQFARAWAALPGRLLDGPLTSPAGWVRPLSVTPWMRWREVVLHHVDLATGFTLAGAGPLGDRLLEDTAAAFAARPDVPAMTLVESGSGRRWSLHSGLGGAEPDGPTVTGSAGSLAGWLTGRSDGSDLACDGALPVLPPLG